MEWRKMSLEDKLKKLEDILRSYGRVLIALSGGVDSSFLLAFACRVFGAEGEDEKSRASEHVAALTAEGPQFPEEEGLYAKALCDRLGIAHKRIDASGVIETIRENQPDRCYHCKKEIFGAMMARAEMTGSVLCDGTNADDMEDYRPGYRAAAELGVASPLKEAGLCKDEIRTAMRTLKTAEDRAGYPAFACLASRIPYGEAVNCEKLTRIQLAEKYLKAQGFSQLRVRCHETGRKGSTGESELLARIELPAGDESRLLAISRDAEKALKAIGFSYVALDIGGYEKGKMNKCVNTENNK